MADEAKADSTGFEQAALPHLDTVYRAAVALCGVVAEAEDLTQTTFLKAFERFDTFRAGTDCKSWLLRHPPQRLDRPAAAPIDDRSDRYFRGIGGGFAPEIVADRLDQRPGLAGELRRRRGDPCPRRAVGRAAADPLSGGRRANERGGNRGDSGRGPGNGQEPLVPGAEPVEAETDGPGERPGLFRT